MKKDIEDIILQRSACNLKKLIVYFNKLFEYNVHYNLLKTYLVSDREISQFKLLTINIKSSNDSFYFYKLQIKNIILNVNCGLFEYMKFTFHFSEIDEYQLPKEQEKYCGLFSEEIPEKNYSFKYIPNNNNLKIWVTQCQ